MHITICPFFIYQVIMSLNLFIIIIYFLTEISIIMTFKIQIVNELWHVLIAKIYDYFSAINLTRVKYEMH